MSGLQGGTLFALFQEGGPKTARSLRQTPASRFGKHSSSLRNFLLAQLIECHSSHASCSRWSLRRLCSSCAHRTLIRLLSGLMYRCCRSLYSFVALIDQIKCSQGQFEKTLSLRRLISMTCSQQPVQWQTFQHCHRFGRPSEDQTRRSSRQQT